MKLFKFALFIFVIVLSCVVLTIILNYTLGINVEVEKQLIIAFSFSIMGITAPALFAKLIGQSRP